MADSEVKDQIVPKEEKTDILCDTLLSDLIISMVGGILAPKDWNLFCGFLVYLLLQVNRNLNQVRRSVKSLIDKDKP
jgi:hypothetical protein